MTIVFTIVAALAIALIALGFFCSWHSGRVKGTRSDAYAFAAGVLILTGTGAYVAWLILALAWRLL